MMAPSFSYESKSSFWATLVLGRTKILTVKCLLLRISGVRALPTSPLVPTRKRFFGTKAMSEGVSRYLRKADAAAGKGVGGWVVGWLGEKGRRGRGRTKSGRK